MAAPRAVTSGTLEGGLNWELTGTDYNYTLTISGSGAMPDFASTHSILFGLSQCQFRIV